MCGVSNYSVSVYLSPLQIPVLELEDGEDMCRLEVDRWEVYSKKKKG